MPPIDDPERASTAESSSTGMLDPSINFITLSFFSSHCIGSSRDKPKSEEHPNFSDGSGPIFNMYMKMAEQEDDKMARRWQKDADGILIFVRFRISFPHRFVVPNQNL